MENKLKGKKDYIKIYSHPRSGTHFLEAFLAKNFYKEDNLHSEGSIYFGHWSNKILLEEGEPYHKLFGSHFFPNKADKSSKMIYVYRDGRAVIASMWNSKFYNVDWEGITFSEFLRKDIDWLGGPGQKNEPKMNIIQHWYKHTNEWLELRNNNLLIIRFEDLKKHPDKIYFEICKKFYLLRYFKDRLLKRDINPIEYKVGLSPNKATINSWKNLFTNDDLEFFYSQIPSKEFLFEE